MDKRPRRTIERMYAILCEGLRVRSGTPLQRRGAVYGKGIYMTEEPATPSVHSSSWKQSTFNNMRILLAYEYLGDSNATLHGSNDIHIIEDPTTLMVKYISLIPTSAAAPFARHVTPAVVSEIASLR